MPKICSVAGCTNHHMNKEKLSFFKFPDSVKEPERRSQWVWACRRQNADGSEWKPTAKYVYVCSQHFISGKPVADPEHPDYIPNIVARTPKSTLKGKKKVERFNSAKRRRLYDVSEPNAEIEVSLEVEESDDETYTATPLNLDLPSCSFEHDKESESINNEEREALYSEIYSLRQERDQLQVNLQDVAQFNVGMIRDNDRKAKFYTGLSWFTFVTTFHFLSEGLRQPGKGSLANMDQFFSTLVKLRQNPKFEYLADQLHVGKSTVIDIFWKWIGIINSKLSFMISWPDREGVFKATPADFKARFPRLTSIIDCFEIFIESPKNLKARAQCYSNYKKHTTIKFLIACGPRGNVIFLSKAWGGRVSDVELTRKSGFISPDLHMPGDQILADRGFTLQEDLATQCSAELILPAFTRGKKQLSAQCVEKSRQLASVRILVERVIGLVKTRFSILQGVLPLTMVNSIKSETLKLNMSSVDLIVRSCAILTNLGDGIQN